MKRRTFFKKAAMSTALAATGLNSFAMSQTPSSNLAPFQLKYAPHIGMFKNHAGDDPIAQLRFMAEEGFVAFEDNEMRNRPIPQQKEMAKTCLLYTSPSPRDLSTSRMPSSA